ncbi:MAG: hypothetical protein Q7V63_03830 [Gammaproteobacteria bacterium]|nr:hypothetical protein [Gammaproteobacteria bacterium]
MAENINGVNHTVIVAPRRYGKSSLVNEVIHENDVPHTWIDLLTVSSGDEVTSKIIKGVSQLIFQLSSDVKKLQLQVQKFFKSLNPEITIGLLGQSMTLHFNDEHSAAIEEILIGLDKYAQDMGKTAVIVFDEFQQICEFKESAKIEAMIRHAVERSKAITYIFSGSNRHLLADMFSSSHRPLYRLCQVMTIDRIVEADYYPFLQNVAREKWSKALSEETLRKIMFYTERHSFYINALCNKLWKQDNIPNEEDVTSSWDWYVNTHKSIIVSDLIDLSLNQKKLVSILAESPTTEVFGIDFLVKTNLSTSSIKQALEVLIKKDIVYKNEAGQYQLLDPGVKYYILNH